MLWASRIVCVLGATIVAVGCRDVDRCPADPAAVLELFTTWTKSAERDAIESKKRAYEHDHAGVRVVHTTMGNFDVFYDYLAWRLGERDESGNPTTSATPTDMAKKRGVPDLFRANIGWDTLRWTQHRKLGVVFPDYDANAGGLQGPDFYPRLINDASDEKGSLYGLPLNIHRINTIYYNKPALENLRSQGLAVDLGQPISISDFEAACAAFKTAYPYKFPIALGVQDKPYWFSSQLVHETLLPALRGVGEYVSLWTKSGRNHITSVEDVYARVIDWKQQGWFNEDYRTTPWEEALKRVTLPNENKLQALFHFMGDWGTAELSQATDAKTPDAKVAGDAFDTTSFKTSVGCEPGAPWCSPFVYTADCLAVPFETRHRKEALELVAAFADPAWQREFSRAKGSIPAKQTTCEGDNATGYDGNTKCTTIDAFVEADQSRTLVLALSGFESQFGVDQDDSRDLNQRVLDMFDAAPSLPSTTDDVTSSLTDDVMDFWNRCYAQVDCQPREPASSQPSPSAP
ncbi:MAG: carbohydrate ABC transporter substrate-binding protein [Polyangiaceae bacterium]|nr:carbohydrate ABC transporter substrate-binding protein [Polyangiaceae bacterium]